MYIVYFLYFIQTGTSLRFIFVYFLADELKMAEGYLIMVFSEEGKILIKICTCTQLIDDFLRRVGS